MKKLKVTVEVGFDADNNIDSAKLDLRNDIKEVVFENTSKYLNIVSFNISEIVLDTSGSDSAD